MSSRATLRELKKKGPWHWPVVGLLIVFGAFLGEWLEKEQYGMALRYELYQALSDLAPNRPHPQIAVVLIGDEEFWKGDLAGRRPPKRDYLARLVRALDAADPELIALDFDLSSPLSDGTLLYHPDYKDETKEFLEAVNDVAGRRTVILAKTVGGDETENLLGADIYDGFEFGDGVKRAHVAASDDIREIPLSLRMQDGKALDSLAEAIVRAVNEDALNGLKGDDWLPYGTFKRIAEFGKRITATQVLNHDPEVFNRIAHKIVIVGGDWNTRGYQRGGQVDPCLTPVGIIPGVYVHANYVEALLCSRIGRPWGKGLGRIIEIFLAVVVAAVFALDRPPWWRFRAVLLTLLVLILFTYLSWQNLGLFFDFFIPSLLVFGHFGYEIVKRWHKRSRAYQDVIDNHPELNLKEE